MAVPAQTPKSVEDFVLNRQLCVDEALKDTVVVVAPGSDERLFGGRVRDDDLNFLCLPILF